MKRNAVAAADEVSFLDNLMTPDEGLTMGRLIRDIALLIAIAAGVGLLGGLFVGGLVGSMLMSFSADPVSTYWNTVGWTVAIGIAVSTGWAVISPITGHMPQPYRVTVGS